MVEDIVEGSEHLAYDPNLYFSLKYIRAAIVRLVLEAFEQDSIPQEEFKILELASGHGLLMRDLTELSFDVSGLDHDPVCVEMSSQFGHCIRGDMRQVDKIFPSESFNLVILSHCLEHMENPKDVVEKVKGITEKWIVIAVPNPARPKIWVKSDLLGRNYSNLGHLCCWDRSHLAVFLERHCDLEIVNWGTDKVHIVPTRLLRSFFRLLGVLELVEARALPRLFPYLSTSLIPLCRLKANGH